MRLRIIHMPGDPDDTDDTVPFGGDTGMPRDEWNDGIVVLTGNECAPDHVTVFFEGEAHFFDAEGSFTPRVEDWSDSRVRVWLDRQLGG